jgi:cytochrome c553
MRGTALTVLAALACLAIPAPDAAAQNVGELIDVCTTCHGEDGLPEDPLVPIIWGQEYYYLYVQLRDYSAGRREHEIMTAIAHDLTKAQMKALAQHFAAQTWPGIGFRAEDADIKAARSMETAGQCVQCHLGGYDGDSRVPRLAGQKPSYLKQTMLAFKNRTRKNAPDKASLLETFDAAGIAAMANYLGGL